MAKIHTPIPVLKLNDGTGIPMLGFGTGTAWYKKGDESQVDEALVNTMVKALDMGYVHLDGAEVYKTEAEVGQAIKTSGIDRSSIFVTTKVGPSVADPQAALQTSLKKMQLDYVDLFLIHYPYAFDEGKDLAGIQKCWAGMEACKAAGLTKSIGVSNFLPVHLDAVLQVAHVVPSINQIEFHAYLQRTDLISYMKKHKIACAAYGPITPATKAKPGPVDDVLAGLSKKYAVSEGEICLRYCIDQDVVAITTSAKEQRMSDYLRCTKFKLTPREIEDLSKAGSEKHFRGFFGNKFAEGDRS